MSLFRNKSFQYGVPFIILIVGGSFGLKEFTQLRYTYRQRQSVYEDLQKVNKPRKEEKVTLESEYEKLKQVDLDNWENVRIPRPWNETLDTK